MKNVRPISRQSRSELRLPATASFKSEESEQAYQDCREALLRVLPEYKVYLLLPPPYGY
ncbi:MAG TPA: hypothetical protein HPP83_08170 [Candidatus Hydrogenedentes bacterium]|nr:hypothetical protein [Candidatus Hydrogenedentota bacterium]